MINKLSTSFPGDLKWLLYINEIVNIACKKLGLLKKLKFSFDRDKLSKIYMALQIQHRICFCRLVYM